MRPAREGFRVLGKGRLEAAEEEEVEKRLNGQDGDYILEDEGT
jgi:hypothetical protein